MIREAIKEKGMVATRPIGTSGSPGVPITARRRKADVPHRVIEKRAEEEAWALRRS
jgi:hypothetical protein